MTTTPGAVVRLLVVAVGVECALALVRRGEDLYAAVTGEGGPLDYLAVVGLLWVLVLALAALVTTRRLRELGARVAAHDEHLAATQEPRRRLASIAHRTERLLAEPDGLTVALQPIVDLATGRWVAVEALARFPDGAPPDHWFAEAHEAGLGVELERLALRRSLELLPVLPPEVELSVNASPALVMDDGFGDLLRGLRGSDAARLVVEITEHASVSHYEEIRAVLLPHRERGVRLAVDDTGAGYSSFAHVLRLRPDVIKLDRSLLSDIDQDAARRAFVTAIVLMALELDARVTAEGVESAGELDTLASLGVDTVQGYLLARPSTDPAVWACWRGRDWLAHAGAVSASNPAAGLRVTYRETTS